jgi:hypothetical protein
VTFTERRQKADVVRIGLVGTTTISGAPAPSLPRLLFRRRLLLSSVWLFGAVPAALDLFDGSCRQPGCIRQIPLGQTKHLSDEFDLLRDEDGVST